MKRKGSAVWTGDLKSGAGTMSVGSGFVKNAPYVFAARFESAVGTNPEELIATAHAGCFSMAFSGELGKAGFTAESIETTTIVTLDFVDGKPTVTESFLKMTAKVPGITPDKFQEVAEAAKIGCPISRLLNAKITLDAKLA
ncbi:MAG: OsmC family protein [bacterium]|nr:OsmC family protein [bacterium]